MLLNVLLLAGAAVSLVYFLLIAIYAGMSSAFGYVWLAAALVLGAGYALRRLMPIRSFVFRPPLWLRVSLITTGMLAVCLFLFVEGLIIRNMFLSYPEHLDYIIVLGAGLEGDRPCGTLAMRLDKALEYMMRNEETMVVVSGGQGPDEPVPEAASMKRYLMERGLEEDRIIEEGHSRNTTENLRNSFSYIVVNWSAREEWEEGKNPTVGVVSNNFHIFRARNIARKQGFSNISGIPAPSEPILLPSQMCREFFALVKDWIVGNL